MKAWPLAAALAAALGASVIGAQQLPAPASFRYERAVLVNAAGPHRLAIDVPLLAAGAPFTVAGGRGPALVAINGLADLRLFDSAGAQIPHILVYAPRSEPDWTWASILPIARTDKTSGFEADVGALQTVDALSVLGIPAPFLKRLTLEGSGDRAHWTVLVADGTLFDLPAESLRQNDLVFAAGAYRYLRVTWDDRNSGRVAPPTAVRVRRVTASPPPARLTSPVAFERRPSEPGVSRFRVRLPAPHLPVVALDLDVRAGPVFRGAIVYESRLVGSEAVPAELGRSVLKRVEREGIATGSMRIPIAAPAEAELELVVDDGSNPPLELSGMTAGFAELPWIYFEAPAGAITARYGNPSASPPAYDLEAVRESVNVAALPDAVWGDPRQRPRDDTVAATSPIPGTGSTVDVAAFTFSRAIPDGAAGLVALSLDDAVLAHSRGPGSRFADARIVDASSRQVPYLVERRNEPLPIPLSLHAAGSVPPELASSPGHSRSTYRVRLPFANLPGSRLALETSAGVFQRSVQVSIERAPDRHRRTAWVDVIGSGGWRHAEPAERAPALILPLTQPYTTEVLLTIDEGDNSPLPITGVKLLLPSYRFRFYHPGGPTLRLLYGSRDVTAPQYDLSLLAPRVMGAEAREVLPGPEKGPDAPARSALVSPQIFWALLGAAVIVLLVLIGRLVLNH